MLDLRRELVVGAEPVARSALDELVAVGDGADVGREVEDLARVDAVVVVAVVSPGHLVAALFVERGELHQREVWEVMPVDVYESDVHVNSPSLGRR